MRPPKHEPVTDLNFDLAARQDYLTGFHKRKQERIKKAQETAREKEKEEKVRERRQVSFFLPHSCFLFGMGWLGWGDREVVYEAARGWRG